MAFLICLGGLLGLLGLLGSIGFLGLLDMLGLFDFLGFFGLIGLLAGMISILNKKSHEIYRKRHLPMRVLKFSMIFLKQSYQW